MGLSWLDGNIFTSECQTLVNTVNCVGVMGAGIALECRLRWPELYKQYATRCAKGDIKIGSLWVYKAVDRWVLNFPTKKHWRFPSREEYLREGLECFLGEYQRMGVTSIAFPLLGAQNGGLSAELSERVMNEYLSTCDIRVEAYRFDPRANDELISSLREHLHHTKTSEASQRTGIGLERMERVAKALSDPSITRLSDLLQIEGVGMGTVEKVFRYARSLAGRPVNASPTQPELPM